MQDDNQSVLTSLSWWCWCRQWWWQWWQWQTTNDHNNNKWPQQWVKKTMATDSNNNTETTKLQQLKRIKMWQQSTCSVRDGGRWQHWQQHQDTATPSSHTANEDSACSGNHNAKTMKLQQWKKCDDQPAVWDMVTVTATSTSTPSSGTADDDSTRCSANHDKKVTTMETVKVQQSTCGVKDDDVGGIDSNLSDSNTMQWHYWQWQTSSGNQCTKQQGPTQQCRLDCSSP